MNAFPYVNAALPPYSCVPGTDCTAQIQQIIDDARATCLASGGNPNQYPSVVYFPGAIDRFGNPLPYQISRPILCDVGGLLFRGDSDQTTQLRAYHGGDCLRVGFSRDGAGIHTSPLTPANWPSNAGILDGSQSAKFGIRTFGTDILTFSASGFDCGPSTTSPNFWAGVSQLTIDVFATPNGGGTICGLDSWYLSYNGATQLNLFYFTSDNAQHQIGWTLPANPSGVPTRFSVQVDIGNGTATAWMNRVQLGDPIPSSVILSGATFIENGSQANQGGTAGQRGRFYVGQLTHDYAFYGLKVSQANLYAPSSAGSDQVRADGQTLNDQRQFFVAEATTCGYLPLTDGRNIYRHEQAKNSHENFYGQWWNQTLQSNFWSGNFTMEDMNLSADWYGGAINFSHPINVRISRCTISGGMRGVDSNSYYPSFWYRVRDCNLRGNHDSAWYGYQQSLCFVGTQFNSYHRSAIRLRGGNVRCADTFIAQVGPPRPQCCVRIMDGQAGGSYLFDNAIIDIEGPAYSPTVAAFNVDGQSYSGGSMLSLRGCGLGALAAGVPHVLLNDPAETQGDYTCFNEGSAPPVAQPLVYVKSAGAPSKWKYADLSSLGV